METGIVVQKARGAQLSKPLEKQFLAWMMQRLGEIAMAQQATVDAETLRYYSATLATYDARDLLYAMTYFCHREREQGETSFPSLPALEKVIVEAQNRRHQAEREQAEREHAAIEAKRRAEHPEEYMTAGDFIRECLAKWNKARADKRKSPWDSLKEAGNLNDAQKAELAEILRKREAK